MKVLLDFVSVGSACQRWIRRIVIVSSAVLIAMSAPGQPAGRVLHGHVPAAVSRLKPIRNLDPSQRLKLVIGLPLHDPEGLANLIAQIYDPASPKYRQYLTPDEFTAQFGPTEQDYESVIAYARAQGFNVTQTFSNRTILDVEGTVDHVQKAFHLTMRQYQHPTENRTFIAPSAEPTIDSSVPILHVTGLNDYFRPRPASMRKSAIRMPSPPVQPALGSGLTGSYMGNDFRKAYASDVALMGTGQSVALFELDGYFPSDIVNYENYTQPHLHSVTLQDVPVDGFSGPSDPMGIGEVSMDIEVALSMAPGLSKIFVYEGNNNGDMTIVTHMLNKIADDSNLVKQISSSWLLPDDPTWDLIYQRMAALGQSFFQASGDNGAFDWTNPNQQQTDNPFITLVGGTTLNVDANGAWLSETTWNWNTSTQTGTAATGGGISPFYGLPTWQQNVSMTLNHGSTTFRNVPDVALTADNIFVIYDNNTHDIFGGTSAAAPLWAAFTALINQQAVANGQAPVGFINPAIYNIGRGANYTTSFHDITTGQNQAPESGTFRFNAVQGYDLCTGWGTPVGQGLINALAPVTRSTLLQFSVNPPNGAALIASANQNIFVTVNDVFSFVNATVTGTIPGVVTNLNFRNDGLSPDARAGDNIYSASIQAPASGTIALTISCTGPNETGITNTVVYAIVPMPANNNFASATKVPSGGASYLSNNRFATIELNEPPHAGDSNCAASLWWDWVAPSSESVFVDTTGSDIDTVLAVYTGSALNNLTQIAAVDDAGGSLQGYLTFNATAGTIYHIAVAGFDSSALGSVRFALTPGGGPDTNRPTVLVSSPLSGLWVSNKLLTVSGTANDPQPNSSGLSQIILVASGPHNQWQFSASGTNIWSGLVVLTPGLNRIQAYALDYAGNLSQPATIQVFYSAMDPVNDLFANAIQITPSSSVAQSSVYSTNATKEFGEPAHAGFPGGKSVWWWFMPTNDGVITLDTSGSSFDTVMGLYTGTNVANLTAIAENDDANDFVISSLISQAVRANQVYHVAVDGYNGVSGDVVLNYSFTPSTVFKVTVGSGGGGTVQVTTVNSAGGVAVMPGTSGDFAANTTVSFNASPDFNFLFNNWTGDVTSSDNPFSTAITGNLNVTGNFNAVEFTDGFESGDLTRLNWTSGGNAAWFVQSSIVDAGQFAARSGFIGNNQSSSLQLSMTLAAGVGSFDYLINSETNFDTLNFYLDGVLQQQWSGVAGWANYTFPVTSGTHTLEWRYVKDASLSSGLDAAFIDDLNLPLPVVTPPAPAHLQLSRQTDGSFMLNLQGQSSQQYIVQSSSDLVHWLNVSTNTAVNGQIQLPVSTGTNQAQFYRALLRQ